jgi:hypothetical protein
LCAGQNGVVVAVGDEDARLALPGCAWRDEARRERKHGVEQLTVRDAEADRVRRAVGETGDGNARRVDAAHGEGAGERAVDGLDVGTVAVADAVPSLVRRGGREQEKAQFVGERPEPADPLLFGSGGAVEEEHEGSGFVRGRGFRDVEESVALLTQFERVLAGLARCGDGGGTGLETRAGGGVAADGSGTSGEEAGGECGEGAAGHHGS